MKLRVYIKKTVQAILSTKKPFATDQNS